MKIRLFLVVFCAGAFAGCTALQTPSKRNQDTVSDFFNPKVNQAYYEFSASSLDKPSVLEENTSEELEQTPGSDEDFTAENVSSAYGTYGDVVVTVATHKFKLGENANRQDILRFQQALDAGYSAALKQYHPVGFTYAMSSVGAVNPLSDIEVTCKLSERSANQVGQSTCRTFFNTVSSHFAQSTKGAR